MKAMRKVEPQMVLRHGVRSFVDEADELKFLAAKAAEYEMLAAMAEDKEGCNAHRAKFVHYAGLADPNSNARFSHDFRTGRRHELLDRANAREREAKKRLRLAITSEIDLRQAEVRAPMQTDKDELKLEIIKVQKNIRHDVLEYEFACKRIDEAQKIAGDRLLALIHRAGIGGAQAIDYQTPKVDGGGKADTLTNAVADAHKRLAKIRQELKGDFRLLEMAIGEGKSLKEIAKLWYADAGMYRPNSRHAEVYIALRFRDALNELVNVFGIARGSGDQPIRQWADHVPLHACGGVTG